MDSTRDHTQMTDHTAIRVGPSVGRWQRFLAWLGRVWRRLVSGLRGPEPTPEPVVAPPSQPGTLKERRRLTAPLVVPASGYTFNFNVHAAFVWTSNGIERESLGELTQYFMPFAVRTLTALAARHARNLSPHRAHDLEVEIQEVLAKQGPWRFSRDDVEITCRPHVWVKLEDRVRQAVEPYWEQLITLDCEHDVQMKRAGYAEKLSEQWKTILADLMGSPFADGAAELTEKQLSAVVQKIVAERRAASEKLDNLLAERIRDGDAFDRIEHFELLKERLDRKGATDFANAATAAAGSTNGNGRITSPPGGSHRDA
jgi:hypothetical protein